MKIFKQKTKGFTRQNFVRQKLGGFIRQTFTVKKLGGFTLIELLVVAAVIALLSSIVMVYLRMPKVEARDAKRKVDMYEINKAMALDYADDNQYSTSDGGVPCVDVGVICEIPLGLGNYLDPIFKDPLSGDGIHDYYWINNTGVGEDQEYCIYAILEKASLLDPLLNTVYFAVSKRGVGQLDQLNPPSTFEECWQ